LREYGVVPFLDFAKINVGNRRERKLDRVGDDLAIVAFEIIRRNNRARTVGSSDALGGGVLRIGQDRIACAKVHRLGGDLRECPARSNRLIINLAAVSTNA